MDDILNTFNAEEARSLSSKGDPFVTFLEKSLRILKHVAEVEHKHTHDLVVPNGYCKQFCSEMANRGFRIFPRNVKLRGVTHYDIYW